MIIDVHNHIGLSRDGGYGILDDLIENMKTNKIDIYGRYVGHIFYSLKETDKDKIFSEGNYLNQELLNRGLARAI